ncbi:glutathione S-transferase family protein [Alkalimarinus coralli]|uniref:glutathione S-transferase family protein n=1 Tax=Alkalimarinus coralli TaxID=2935863 RepID=UPI00202B4B2F|nr:glutathione S-transferase family protein [Alkalimarinus coralli]
MYTLYYLPSACSLATQVVLRELGQEVDIIDMQKVADFNSINPVGSVPVLVDGDSTHREGAAIMLYLLNKHDNTMLPTAGEARETAIQNIMFANATMHPAYGRLFFIAQYISDEKAKQQAFEAAAQAITRLWQVVDLQLEQQEFLGGAQPSAADIMLTVYSRWGANFPVDIQFGHNTQKMIEKVQTMTSFRQALETEQLRSAA